MDENEIIREQAEKIDASGVLGRSRSYARLLAFLVACSADGRTPKELEIAAEVFGKGADFDPSQDSMVRVYAHNLRQKLKQFYETSGRDEAHRIALPRGEYRITVLNPQDDSDNGPDVEPRIGRYLNMAVAGLLILALGIVIGLGISAGGNRDTSVYTEIAASPIWNPLLDDELPILVVVGDYYIFGELDPQENVARLVREFSVNSSKDLDNLVMFEPALASRYIDLDLTYLPRGAAFALRDLLRVLYISNKSVRVVSMSEFSVADLKTNHIVYVGYISALDKLIDFVFASSALAVGDTFDELWHKDSGEVYISEAGLPADSRNYRDYGLFSTFPGPSGNQIVVVAGTRDAGLMHSAQALTDPMHVRAIEQALPEAMSAGPRAFELLYEVTGFDRTNLDAMLVHSAILDYQEIWGGEFLQAGVE